MNFFRIIEYYKRAHVAYFGFIIQLLNFFNILFLLGVSIGVFKGNLESYIGLILVFVVIIFPSAIVIGWLDYSKGSFVESHKIIKEKSPIYQDLFKLLDDIHTEICKTDT